MGGDGPSFWCAAGPSVRPRATLGSLGGAEIFFFLYESVINKTQSYMYVISIGQPSLGNRNLINMIIWVCLSIQCSDQIWSISHNKPLAHQTNHKLSRSWNDWWYWPRIIQNCGPLFSILMVWHNTSHDVPWIYCIQTSTKTTWICQMQTPWENQILLKTVIMLASFKSTVTWKGHLPKPKHAT